MKILIIEDNVMLAEQISNALISEGFVTHIEYDGENGHFEGTCDDYDIILLDIGIPKKDGFTVLEQWRNENIQTPVIIITARNSKIDTIKGLEIGADDYICKPIDVNEVVARVRANLRRSKGKGDNIAQYQNVVLNFNEKRVTANDEYIKLTRTEFMIVQYLFINQGRTININELSDHVYNEFDNNSAIIAKHIGNIRKKIGYEIIKTESNRGYYIPFAQEA